MQREYLRIVNLRALVVEFGTVAEVARRSHTESNYLYQVINEYRTKAGNPRTLGNEMADKIEDACGKPRGWLDTDHSQVKLDQLTSEEAALIELYRKANDELRKVMLHLARMANDKN